jgi:hypothetical protein
MANDITDCLKLTKALQKTAESLQSVADIHDDNVRGLFWLPSIVDRRFTLRLDDDSSPPTRH